MSDGEHFFHIFISHPCVFFTKMSVQVFCSLFDWVAFFFFFSVSIRDVYVGELLELPQGCQGPFPGSSVKVGFLLRRCSGKGPHLALRAESPSFS